MPSNTEESYLQALINDFSVDSNLSPRDALRMIGVRYQQLENQTDNFIRILSNSQVAFSEFLKSLASILHAYLFNDILSNAGSYRKATDPNNGFVGFGSDKVRNPSLTEFQGSPTAIIEPELSKAFRLLSRDDKDPIRTAIVFYQRFVLVHPFYDANGRIARFLVSLYLSFHGYYVRWKIIDEKNKIKFIKKLNQCHLRYEKDGYEKYLNYLVDFWKEFVGKLSELEEK